MNLAGPPTPIDRAGSMLRSGNLWLMALCGLVLAAMQACNAPEPMPGQLAVDRFSITDTTGAPIPDVDISDVWVYVDGRSLGIFRLPARVPLPFEGRHQIRLYAGVMADRVQGQRIQYPFYSPYQDSFNLTPGTRLELNPTVKLVNVVKLPYPFEETFETDPLSVDSGFNGKSPVVRQTAGVHPAGGQYYGQVTAAPAGNEVKLLEITQKKSIPLSASGRPIYLELLYKNSTHMQVGIYAIDATGAVAGALPRVVFTPSTEWKKAYVFLSSLVTDAGTQTSYTFKVYCRAVADSNEATSIAVDNLRLVQFK